MKCWWRQLWPYHSKRDVADAVALWVRELRAAMWPQWQQERSSTGSMLLRQRCWRRMSVGARGAMAASRQQRVHPCTCVLTHRQSRLEQQMRGGSMVTAWSCRHASLRPGMLPWLGSSKMQPWKGVSASALERKDSAGRNMWRARGIWA